MCHHLHGSWFAMTSVVLGKGLGVRDWTSIVDLLATSVCIINCLFHCCSPFFQSGRDTTLPESCLIARLHAARFNWQIHPCLGEWHSMTTQKFGIYGKAQNHWFVSIKDKIWTHLNGVQQRKQWWTDEGSVRWGDISTSERKRLTVQRPKCPLKILETLLLKGGCTIEVKGVGIKVPQDQSWQWQTVCALDSMQDEICINLGCLWLAWG